MEDAFFLVRHPSWTWRDLQDTPDDILTLIKRIEAAKAGVQHG